MIVQRYNLSFDTGEVKPIIVFSKYDTARMIELVLDFTPTSAELKVNGTTMECSIENNIVSFLYSALNVGDMLAELRCDGMGSVNFIIRIEDTPLDDNTLLMANLSRMEQTSPSVAEIKPSEELEVEEELKEETEESVFLDEKENENEERESSL